MLSIEMRVNGALIGYIDIRNQSKMDGIYFYSVKYRKIGEKPRLLSFSVAHKREEGAEKLALLTYQKISELLKKEIGERE